MKTVTGPIAGIMVLGLAACGGGGSDSAANDFVISSGILELEIPDASEREGLSEELNDAISAIQLANEEGTAATPGGNATYSGVFGMGVDDDAGSLVTGDVAATFTFADSDMDITFTATAIETDEPLEISGSFGATGLSVTDGLYSGAATGTLTVEDDIGEEDVLINANIEGAIAGSETFGDFEGVLTNPDDTSDTFGGLFYGQEPL